MIEALRLDKPGRFCRHIAIPPVKDNAKLRNAILGVAESFYAGVMRFYGLSICIIFYALYTLTIFTLNKVELLSPTA